MTSKIGRIAGTLSLTGTTTLGACVRLMLFWNPIVVSLFSLIDDPRPYPFASWCTGLFVADTTAVLCVLGVRLLQAAFRYRARSRHAAAPAFSRMWTFRAAILMLLVVIYPGIQSGRLPYLLMGWPWQGPGIQSLGSSFLNGMLILTLFSLVQLARESRDMERSADLRIQKIENERLQAQLTALTAQMNPHLLFNALNTIASLVQSNPDQAEETAVKLSELYRGVLHASGRTLHSLERELDICRAYLAVERARFGLRLGQEIQIGAGIDLHRTEVPVLIIQPLLENAVRHGILPLAAGGKVWIKVDRVTTASGSPMLSIRVEDDGVGYGRSPVRGNGISLANISDRLRLMFDGNATLSVGPGEAAGTVATLQLPVYVQGGIHANLDR